MKPYEVTTLWLTMMMGIIVILIVIGGYFSRGYIAFDAGFLILLLSPAIILTWYSAEKREYQYRKYTRREK